MKIFGLAMLFIGSINASIRIDVEDRTPEECAEKSRSLGRTLAPAQVTGLVTFVTGEKTFTGNAGTGVAIDRYTVLTAAHLLQPNSESTLLSTSWPFFTLTDCPSSKSNYIKVKSFHIHKQFVSLSSEAGKKIPLKYSSSLENMSLQEYIQKFGLVGFSGVDLCVMKLASPLPADLLYPEILGGSKLSDAYGITAGFGELKFNDPKTGPRRVSDDPGKFGARHVFSSSVSSDIMPDDVSTPILLGHYKGIIGNGDEFFTPTEDMRKTEGLPVSCDSGGPFFIDDGGTYKLAGIVSRTFCLSDVMDASLRSHQLKQPVYPVWTDVRPHMDWIKSLMSPSV